MIMIVMMIMAMNMLDYLMAIKYVEKNQKLVLIIKAPEGGFSPRERGEQGGMRLNQNLNLESNKSLDFILSR